MDKYFVCKTGRVAVVINDQWGFDFPLGSLVEEVFQVEEWTDRKYWWKQVSDKQGKKLRCCTEDQLAGVTPRIIELRAENKVTGQVISFEDGFETVDEALAYWEDSEVEFDDDDEQRNWAIYCNDYLIVDYAERLTLN